MVRDSTNGLTDMRYVSTDALSRRIDEMEASLVAARREIDTLRRSASRSRRSSALAGGFLIGTIGLAAWIGLGAVTHAQTGTVTAPFVVIDRNNKKILEVTESDDHARNLLLLYNKSEQIIAVAKSTDSGRGALGVADGEKFCVLMRVATNGDGAFVVMNKDNKPIADISRGRNGGQGLGFYSPSGELMGEVMATADGRARLSVRQNDRAIGGLYGSKTASYLALADAAGGMVALLGKPEQGAGETGGNGGPRNGLSVYDPTGAPVVFASADDQGYGHVRVQGRKNDKAAIIGVTEAGPALALRQDNKTLVALAAVGGKPALDMTSYQGTAIVEITEGSNGGKLQLGDLSGNAMVEAGVTQGGLGLVRTFPMGNPGRALLGLPGTFILGKQSDK